MVTVATVLARKNRAPVSIQPGAFVLNALRLMAEKDIGSLVVMNGTEYLGMITERDYSRKVVLKGKNSTETTVAAIMSTDLPVVGPHDTIDHCMELMSNENIRYLPVFDKNQLTGIISMTDVVKETILQQKETILQLQNYISS